MSLQFPDILRPFWGRAIWRKNPSEKVIYLTFDDGPEPKITPLVLEILEKEQIKATFFCVGENVVKYPETYLSLIRGGHKTGNHTYNHLKGFSVTTSEYIENVRKAADTIESKLFRPPYGRITFKQKKALQDEYQIIMWDIITHDYNRNLSPESIFKNVKRYSRNGSIVVFHDSIKSKYNMMAVLPLAIEFWKSKGYSFGVL